MKLNLLWQSRILAEDGWIREIFAPFTEQHFYDGEWAQVMDNCLLIDTYLHHHPASYYRQFRGKNAFLLHVCDETYEGGYENYDNFRGVFRFYWSGIFNSRRVLQLPLGYSNGFIAGDWEPGTARRPYLWSFLGGAGKSSRPEMMKALEPLTPHFAHITDRGKVAKIDKQGYSKILRDSVFVPSSMGNVNLECYRIYETLDCGAIPILESRWGFDYFRELLGDHPIPTFTTWSQAARFLKSIQNDRVALDALQKECVGWWGGYKKTLTGRIETMIGAPAGDEAGGYVHWQRSIPGSQAVELLRHHTVPAVMRRAKVQLDRVLKEGKLRKTTGA